MDAAGTAPIRTVLQAVLAGVLRRALVVLAVGAIFAHDGLSLVLVVLARGTVVAAMFTGDEFVLASHTVDTVPLVCAATLHVLLTLRARVVACFALVLPSLVLVLTISACSAVVGLLYWCIPSLRARRTTVRACRALVEAKAAHLALPWALNSAA